MVATPTVVDLGGAPEDQEPTASARRRGELFDEVDAACCSKYGATAGDVVSALARATTLRLDPL